MFLTDLQRKRLDAYADLSSRERATFNFRIADKVSTFLNDVSEVNQVLKTIPFNYHQKSFKEDHVDLVFDLLEHLLAGLDYAPIIKNDQDGTPQRFKGFLVVPRTGKGAGGQYHAILPASDEDLARAAHLQNRIRRLEQFTTARLISDEFRPRSYFEALPESVEKNGMIPVIPGFQEAIVKARIEDGLIPDVPDWIVEKMEEVVKTGKVVVSPPPGGEETPAAPEE